MTTGSDGREDGKGNGRLGVREIARRVGVAPITVSRVISNSGLVSADTRAKVLAAIDEAGFVPNRLASSMRRPGRIVGTVVPPLLNSGIAEQVQGMSDECQEQGYSMILVQGEFTSEDEERSVRMLLSWRPAGLILQSFVPKRGGAPARRDDRHPCSRDLRDQGAPAHRHGRGGLELRDGLHHDHAPCR
jgi:LacI family gluconate utilization system Gnt-I transcriptional repressor